MSVVTCHTSGCANAGTPVFMDLTYVHPQTEDVEYVDAVICGVCLEPITDIELGEEGSDA